MIEENLKKIFGEISCGNPLGEKITLVGATKTVSVENINYAMSCGLKIVGDNKVQEFRDKSPFIKGADFHFIGHLQTNKVKYLIGKVSLIESVDSLPLVKEIDRLSIKNGLKTNILIEVNAGKEESKSGVFPEDVFDFVNAVKEYKSVTLKGIMAMLPKCESESNLEPLCLKMRDIYDKIKKNYPIDTLSMGMSEDYKTAIKCGSNMIRLGSAIFGKRNYQAE